MGKPPGLTARGLPRGPSRRQMGRPRTGFILLFGTRAIASDEPSPPVYAHCPQCGRESDLVAKSSRNWFTFFFIPVFPISGRTEFCECANCHAQFNLKPDELRARLAQPDREQNQKAISLYNSLRASPANSITLNELMMTYASMKEYDQAVSAAREFPQALNSSEQCMATLGRVLLAQDKFPEALQWFDASVARNPSFGEAQYYKAVAHLLMTPPQYDRAGAAARAARGAGYPNADALLREAEAKARGEGGEAGAAV